MEKKLPPAAAPFCRPSKMTWDDPSTYSDGAFMVSLQTQALERMNQGLVVYSHNLPTKDVPLPQAKLPETELSEAASPPPVKSKGTLTEFHIFSSLPPELQLMVWGYAISAIEPRLISIVPGACGSVIPTILQACHGSRREALKPYKSLRCGEGGSDIEYPILSDHNYDIAFAHETCVEEITGHVLPWTIKRAMETHPYIFKHKHVAINISHLLNLKYQPFTPYTGRWGFRETWDLHEYNPDLETIMLVLKNEHGKTFNDLAELDEDDIQRAHFDEARSTLEHARKEGKLLFLYFQVAVFVDGSSDATENIGLLGLI